MTEKLEYKIGWNDVEIRAQEREKIALAVDDEADQRGLVSNALLEMETFFGNDAYFNAMSQLNIGVMAPETPTDLGIFVASTHEAGLHAAMNFAEVGAAPTMLVYDINIMGQNNPMNGIEAALDAVALTGGKAPVVFFTAYDAKDFRGFRSASLSDGLFYIVQKAEGTERLKTVVREAQYCADVVAVLEEIKGEKEQYLMRLEQLGIELSNTSKDKDIPSVAPQLEQICRKVGVYETFPAVHVQNYMHETLTILETVEGASSRHPLGEVAEEQSRIDQRVAAMRQKIRELEIALNDGEYQRVPRLIENLTTKVKEDDEFFSLMDPTWGNGKATVFGEYVFERLKAKCPGGIDITKGAYSLGPMSYDKNKMEDLTRGLQVLLIAAERTLRETTLEAEGNIRATIDGYVADSKNMLYLTFKVDGRKSSIEETKKNFEAQIAYTVLAPKLFGIVYTNGQKPRIEPSYNDTGIVIRVELPQQQLL